MNHVTRLLAALGLALAAPACATTDGPRAGRENALEIRSVAAQGKTLRWRPGGELRLGAFPENILFTFGPATNATLRPLRLRYKLEGYDPAWREGGGEMFLLLRFYDEAGEEVGQRMFRATGESPGWNRAPKDSTLTHRRETLTAPPRAARLMVSISSGGPPATVGLLVVDDLVISRIPPHNGSPEILLRSPFGEQTNALDLNPRDWRRDGSRPSMAKIMELGEPKKMAFAILDEDPVGHAEWHIVKEAAPRIEPEDKLLLEWNEFFSLGVGDIREAHYDRLPPGKYRFRVMGVQPLGSPTGVETSLAVQVPLPFWELTWFWAALGALAAGGVAVGARYHAWRRMRAELLELEHQRALEQERVRIAQDIHDDLGARVTQISLLSGMARSNATTLDQACADFDRISALCRELVSALYETVWAVNPENDNLDALGDYLGQKAHELCQHAGLRCRLDVGKLPRESQVSSQTRHNVTMAVKEVVHNVVKHSHASELTMKIGLEGDQLQVAIQDDGSGFSADAPPTGNGLANVKRRMEDLGGSCRVESRPGAGTSVYLRLPVGATD